MSLNSFDSEFDRYRKNRMRFRNKEQSGASAGSYDNHALRELELVEAREVRDQQLTREVHEFFATATQQAAGIVERMAQDVEAQADVKVEQEMEAFLIDAFARMNSLVMALIHKRKSGTAETRLEPRVANLVGQMLDEFRWEGTADLIDKHIGQDPFATDLDDVRRELQTHISEAGVGAAAGNASAPIEEHLVATVDDTGEGADRGPVADQHDDRTVAVDVAEPEQPHRAAAVAHEAPRAASTVAAAAVADAMPAPAAARGWGQSSKKADELERFKEALKSLVRQGTMTRDEARAAWVTRLKSISDA